MEEKKDKIRIELNLMNKEANIVFKEKKEFFDFEKLKKELAQIDDIKGIDVLGSTKIIPIGNSIVIKGKNIFGVITSASITLNFILESMEEFKKDCTFTKIFDKINLSKLKSSEFAGNFVIAKVVPVSSSTVFKTFIKTYKIGHNPINKIESVMFSIGKNNTQYEILILEQENKTLLKISTLVKLELDKSVIDHSSLIKISDKLFEKFIEIANTLKKVEI